MARRVFYSFHFDNDIWRANQVRNMGVVEGDAPVSGNEWEKIKKADGVPAWIAAQMSGKSCAVVLIGSATATRPWVLYEIDKAWNDGKGVVGVHIHGLENTKNKQSTKGTNPLDKVTCDTSKKLLSTLAKTYDPPFVTSTFVYDHIKANLADWVEEAITIRADT